MYLHFSGYWVNCLSQRAYDELSLRLSELYSDKNSFLDEFGNHADLLDELQGLLVAIIAKEAETVHSLLYEVL